MVDDDAQTFNYNNTIHYGPKQTKKRHHNRMWVMYGITDNNSNHHKKLGCMDYGYIYASVYINKDKQVSVSTDLILLIS